MFVVKLATDAALGNGTRKRGEILAKINAEADEFPAAVRFEATKEQLAKIKPEKDVELSEVLTALRNPSLCEFLGPREAAKQKKEQEEQDRAGDK